MAISRRSLLKHAGALVAATTAAGSLHASFTKDGNAQPLSPFHIPASVPHLSIEMFDPLVGSTFRALDAKRNEIIVKLVAVKPLAQQDNPSRHAFSLRFQQTAGRGITQQTYRFEHGTAGTFDLFVVPAVANARNATLTAIVNRL